MALAAKAVVLTVRAGSSWALAENPESVKRIAQLYWNIEHAAIPSAVLLPWIPSKARKMRTDALKELYDIIKADVDDRLATGRKDNDAVQLLLDHGDGLNKVVEVSEANPLT